MPVGIQAVEDAPGEEFVDAGARAQARPLVDGQADAVRVERCLLGVMVDEHGKAQLFDGRSVKNGSGRGGHND